MIKQDPGMVKEIKKIQKSEIENAIEKEIEKEIVKEKGKERKEIEKENEKGKEKGVEVEAEIKKDTEDPHHHLKSVIVRNLESLTNITIIKNLIQKANKNQFPKAIINHLKINRRIQKKTTQ
jgi:hypothetical protein